MPHEIRFDFKERHQSDNTHRLGVRHWTPEGQSPEAAEVFFSDQALQRAPCDESLAFWFGCAQFAANRLYDELFAGAEPASAAERRAPLILRLTDTELGAICRSSEQHGEVDELEPEVTVLRTWP